jgi:hypothetical protein
MAKTRQDIEKNASNQELNNKRFELKNAVDSCKLHYYGKYERAGDVIANLTGEWHKCSSIGFFGRVINATGIDTKELCRQRVFDQYNKCIVAANRKYR